MMLEEKIKKREEEIAKVNTDLVDGVGKMMLEEGKVKVPYVEINKNLMDEGMVEISLSKEDVLESHTLLCHVLNQSDQS